MNDKELEKLVREFANGVIGNRGSKNMCYAVCCPLAGLLEMTGVPVKLVECEVEHWAIIFQHYYLEMQDGRIIDPTADQFNSLLSISMPQIYIGAKPEHYKSLTPA